MLDVIMYHVKVHSPSYATQETAFSGFARALRANVVTFICNSMEVSHSV